MCWEEKQKQHRCGTKINDWLTLSPTLKQLVCGKIHIYRQYDNDKKSDLGFRFGLIVIRLARLVIEVTEESEKRRELSFAESF